MPKFRYRALDAQGEPAEGVIEENSAKRVVALLREQGMQVSSVQRLSAPVRRAKGVSWNELHLFNEQMKGLVSSGLPIPAGLRAIAGDIGNRRLSDALDDMRQSVEAGNTLGQAFGRHEDVFPPVYRTMIEAGERSGNLSEVLDALTAWSERMVARRHQLQVVVAYPLFVFAATFLMLGAMLLFIVPSFQEFYSGFGGSLPPPTRLIVAMSRALRSDGPLLLIVGAVLVAGVFVVFNYARRHMRASIVCERLLWGTPFVGRMYRHEATARFSRILGALLAAAVPAPEALRLAAAAADSASLHRAGDQAALHVEAGNTIGDALAQTGLFSHSFCWMAGTGETAGQLPQVFASLAALEDRQCDARSQLALTLLGPVLVGVTGIIIGWMFVSLYMPIFTLGDAVLGV